MSAPVESGDQKKELLELEGFVDSLAELVDQFGLRLERIYEIMERMQNEVNGVQNASAALATAASTIGVAGGVATLVGIIIFPPVAILGGIIGVGSSVSSVGARVLNVQIMKDRINDLKKLMDAEHEFFNSIKCAIGKLENGWANTFSDGKFPTSDFCGGGYFFLGAASLAAKTVLMQSSARLGNGFAKKIALSVLGVGIIFDAINLHNSIKELEKGGLTEFSKNIEEMKSEMKQQFVDLKNYVEHHRQNLRSVLEKMK